MGNERQRQQPTPNALHAKRHPPRDPASRAYSHYVHNCRAKHRRANREPLSFEEAISQEPSRIAGEYERMVADETYDSRAYRHYSYAQRGMYREQLERYAEYFDRRQMLIVKAEDLFQNTQQCYDKVLDFLELQPRVISKPRVRNAGKYEARPDAALAQPSEFSRRTTKSPSRDTPRSARRTRWPTPPTGR